MVAAVYIVGGDGDREDLRYSIRSLINAPCIDDVWVVGDVPAWFGGVRVPLDPLPEKFANQRQSVTRFVNLPGAPEAFYLLNDDMYVREPVAGDLPTCRNRHPLSRWTDVERNERPLNTWHRAVISTGEWTAEQTGTDPFVYECHTPLLFDTALLRDAVNRYPAGRPFAVGELYPIAGIGGAGEHCGNAKVKAHDSLEAKLANPMPYLSGNPDTWVGAFGDLIRRMFPHPSRYETDHRALEVAA